MQAIFVEAKEAARAFVVDAALTDGGLHVRPKLAQQHLGIELYVVENLADGVALDQRVEACAAVRVEADVHGVRVAEQVVKVSEDLLVGADEKYPEVIRGAVDRVQRQRFLHVAAVDEAIELPV